MAARLILLLIGLVCLPTSVAAQSYTITPTPFQTAFDNSGNIINGSCVWTYLAGTSTPATTYSDNIGTSNANPIRSDSAGRFTAYLVAGTAYKFTYEQPCTPPAHGSVLRTADNIAGTPASAASVDVSGVAGETISAGQAVYLSDGSGSKTSGQWFKADNTNTYSSTTAEVGIAPSAILSGATGTIRLVGQVTGLSALSTGSTYYVGTTGAITSTAPSNNRRQLGVADSATTLILRDPYQPPINLTDCNGRLTLETGVPISTTDQTAKGTLYWTPYKGNRCALYDGKWWTTRTFAELSIAVPAATSQLYDVWLYDNAGTVSLELLAWTNDTTRATALTTQDGVLVKTGATTRRYLGSMRTTTVANQTEDSLAKRYVWNNYNRVPRAVRRIEASASWTYTTNTIRQANGAAANQVDIVVGVAEVPLQLMLLVGSRNTNADILRAAGIGEDSTTTFMAQQLIISNPGGAWPINQTFSHLAMLNHVPAVGRHFYAWNEISAAAGTTTWDGTGNLTANNAISSGLSGSIPG